MKKTKAICGILLCIMVLSANFFIKQIQEPTAKIGWWAADELTDSEGAEWFGGGVGGYVGGVAGAGAATWAGAQIGGTAGTFIGGPVGTVIGGAIGAGVGAL